MKKFPIYTLIIATAALAFFYGAHTAHAIGFLDVLSDPEMAVVVLAGWVIYALVYLPTATALYIAGQIFNFSLALSLNSGKLGSSIVDMGWAISRDVANLFFIFILLYIAIAVMLRLSGYGAKQLLTRLIIVALLINFSLVFAKVVIDTSNMLALTFYNNISVESGPLVTTILGEGARDLSAVFMSGFSPQKLFNSQEFENTLKGSSYGIEALLYTVIKFILAAVITLMAAFILLAAAGLFIIRTVVLWIVMILAPVAFIAMILPATASTSRMWWDSLLKQSFFAPAFMFFYYLVARMVSEKGGFLSQVKVPDTGAMGLISVMQGSLAIFMQFSVLGALLIACLMVAQKMGAVGANTAMAWGAEAQKKARGYAGTMAGRTFVAPVAQAIAKSPTMQNIAASFPRLGGAALRTAQRGAKIGEKVTEQRVATGMTLPPEARAEYLENLGKGVVGGKYIGADKNTQMEMMKKMPARERVEMLEKAKTPEQKTTVEGLINQLPVEEKEKTMALHKERESTLRTNTALEAAKAAPGDRINSAALMSALTAPQLTKIMDEGGDKLNTVFGALKNLGTNLNEITSNIEQLNPALAGYIAGQPRAQRTFRIMLGEKEAAKKPEKVEPGEEKLRREEELRRAGL